jgi:hypothetical protein
MNFPELVTSIKKLRMEEVRVDTRELYEFVIHKETLTDLTVLLEGYFGSALKPAGQWASKEAKEVTAPFRGIRRDQTLYYAAEGAMFNCALLWPWSNGMMVTVKIINGKRTGFQAPPAGLWAKMKSTLFGLKE